MTNIQRPKLLDQRVIADGNPEIRQVEPWRDLAATLASPNTAVSHANDSFAPPPISQRKRSRRLALRGAPCNPREVMQILETFVCTFRLSFLGWQVDPSDPFCRDTIYGRTNAFSPPKQSMLIRLSRSRNPPARWPCYYRGFSRLSRALWRKKQLKRRGDGVDVSRRVINCAGNYASGLVNISGDFVRCFRPFTGGDSMVDIIVWVCRGGMRSGVEFLCWNFTWDL